MLLTQALLSAWVNCALAALKDQDLKKELLDQHDKIKRAPWAFAKKLDRLSVDLCARDILKRPESLGETLAAGLAVTTLARHRGR